MHAWEIGCEKHQNIHYLYAGDLKQLLEQNEKIIMLDVLRKSEGLEKAHLPDSQHTFFDIGHTVNL